MRLRCSHMWVAKKESIAGIAAVIIVVAIAAAYLIDRYSERGRREAFIYR